MYELAIEEGAQAVYYPYHQHYPESTLHMKVLIVDDNIDLSILLRKYFTRKGYQVFMSHTLQDGIQKMESEQPDILLLDNNLPDAVGWKEAPVLAAHYPQCFLFLISAFHPQEPFMPNHANFRVLEKPLSFASLDEVLTDVAQRSKPAAEA